ncbi:hypothetical protein EIP91_003650 [Steccherinum ochraceum]|uniref:Thioesterase domain-containing protein n=1 Tax=Steccherinum ochraceum TaxID=92696 RepID=A0A4R0RIK8_9APHY|nr:hypothetical protein EIP91_003650 [Steccherinum ochraceum]
MLIPVSTSPWDPSFSFFSSTKHVTANPNESETVDFGGKSGEKMLTVLRPILSAVPSVLKWSAALFFLVNCRSWPLVWHFKVWRPIWRYQFRVLFLRMSLLLKSRKEKQLAMDKFFESFVPVGKSPFEAIGTYRTWAGPDDCDFNMHLSNSSYAKNLDMARFNAALSFLPSGFIAGAWMGVGATHFKYLREIPIFSKYEMRTSIAAWDHKWMYVLTRYVTRSKKKSNSKKSPSPTPGQATPPVGTPFMPPTHTPATTHDTPSCLSPYDSALNDLIASLSAREEADGATLHCVVITEVCFKIGRITVPPSVALAADGYCVPPSSSSSSTDILERAEPYSRANPPPHWERVRAMKARGNFKPLQNFLKGGWKDVPEEERWWMSALGGEIEEKRRLNLDLVSGVQRGMEGARYV